MSLDGHSEGWVETGDGLTIKSHGLVFGSGEQISSRQHREAETYETVLPGSTTENRKGAKSTASLRHMDAHPQSCACGKFPLPFRILNSPHHWGALQEKYQQILISRHYETQELHPYLFVHLFKTQSHLSQAHIPSDALSSQDDLMVLLPPLPKYCSSRLPPSSLVYLVLRLESRASYNRSTHWYTSPGPNYVNFKDSWKASFSLLSFKA